MDTRMIDVAIGLVLVFAITSLLVTALQEISTSYFERRGKLLKESILSLLQGDESLTRDIFDFPLVSALYRGDRLPSYLPTDVFVTTLLNLVGQPHNAVPREGTPAEFVARLQAGAAAARPVLKMLPVLLQGVERDWAAFEGRIGKWYDDVGERATGWFKRDTQRWLFLIGLATAAALNIDALAIASALWKDEALRNSVVNVAQQVSEARDGTAAGQAAAAPAVAALQEGSPQTLAVEQALGSLKARLTTVATGQQQAQSQRSSARAALAGTLELASQLASERKLGLADTVQRQGQQIVVDRALEAISHQAADGQLPADVSAILSKLREALAAERGQRQARRSANCSALATEYRQACENMETLDSLAALGIPMGWNCQHPLLSRMNSFCENGADTPPGQSPSLLSVLLGCIAGWMVVAIATTLGAPFWFDMLNKLVKLRASGVRVTGDAGPAPAAPAAPPGATTTPSTPAAGASSDALSDAEQQLTDLEISRLQRQLGMPNAEHSGRLDLKTRDYIRQWQDARGRSASGVLTAQELVALLDDQPEEPFEG